MQNLLREQRRTEATRHRRENAAATIESLPSTAEAVERKAAIRSLTDAVHQLGEPYYSTLMLRYFDGLMPMEIAQLSGLPVATVKRRLERALEQLRHSLPEKRTGALVVGSCIGARCRDWKCWVGQSRPAGGLVMLKKIIGVVALISLIVALSFWLPADEDPVEFESGPVADTQSEASQLRRHSKGLADNKEVEDAPEETWTAHRDLDLFGVVSRRERRAHRGSTSRDVQGALAPSEHPRRGTESRETRIKVLHE